MSKRRMPILLFLLIPALLLGCETTGPTEEPPAGATITISPAEVSLSPGSNQTFVVTLAGIEASDVEWSATGGSLQADGVMATFTAPQALGSYEVQVRSRSHPTVTSTAAVLVTDADAEDLNVIYAQSDSAGLVTFTDVDQGVNITLRLLDVATGNPLPNFEAALLLTEDSADVVIVDPEHGHVPLMLSLSHLRSAPDAGEVGTLSWPTLDLSLPSWQDIQRVGQDIATEASRLWSSWTEISKSFVEWLGKYESQCYDLTLGEVPNYLASRLETIIDSAGLDVAISQVTDPLEKILSTPGLSNLNAAYSAWNIPDTAAGLVGINSLAWNTALTETFKALGYLNGDPFVVCEVDATYVQIIEFSTFLILPVGDPGEFTIGSASASVVLLDDETSQPIGGQRVQLIGFDPRTTDSNGRVTFTELGTGQYALSVAVDGYLPVTTGFSLYGDQDFNVVLRLRRPAAEAPNGFLLRTAQAICYESGPAVNLTWEGSQGASSYAIFRNGQRYYEPVSGTSFVNTANVVPGATYTYEVEARSAGGVERSANARTVTVPVGICTQIPPPTGEPRITSMAPSPVPPLNGRQWLTINGENFAASATVTLYSRDGAHPIPSDRTTVDSGSRIRVFVNVTTEPAEWSAVVTNPLSGESSVPYSFTVGGGASNLDPVVHSFTATPSSGEAPLAVRFSWDISDADGDALTCGVAFGDGNSQDVPNCHTTNEVWHTYTVAGTHSANLIVLDGNGGGTSSATTVFVDVPPVEGADPRINYFAAEGSNVNGVPRVEFFWNISDPDGDPLTCAVGLQADGVMVDSWTINNCQNRSGYSANVTSPGTYTAAIVVQDPSGRNVSDWVFVTVPRGPSFEPGELLTNGDFSQQSSGWTLSGDFWIGASGNYRSAPYLAAGGVDWDGYPTNDAYGSMTSNWITIPSGASDVELTFWYNITTEESGSSVWDAMGVYVEDDRYRLELVATRNNTHASSAGSYTRVRVDLSGYVGETIRLIFEAESDGSNPTVFRIDDVSLYAQ